MTYNNKSYHHQSVLQASFRGEQESFVELNNFLVEGVNRLNKKFITRFLQSNKKIIVIDKYGTVVVAVAPTAVSALKL